MKTKPTSLKDYFSKLDLARKMSFILAAILIGCFAALIFSVGNITQNAMSDMIYSDFNNMADANASRIQSALDEAALIAENMQSYIQREYDRGSTMTEAEKGTGISPLYGTVTNGLNAEVESYMLNEMWSTIENSDNIMGMGCNFEPYLFDSSIRSYATYITEEDTAAKRAAPFGEYETYCNEPYYVHAKESKQPYYTEPYEFDGIKRIIASFPILYKNEFQGVITVNIVLDRFDDLVKISENYPTMYSSIYTHDGITVFDTDGDDYAGKHFRECFDSNEQDLAAIQSGMDSGVAFICSVTDDNDHYNFFFVPINAGSHKWWSLTAVQTADMNSSLHRTMLTMIGLMVVILAIITIITVYLLRKMLKPIQAVVVAAESIAHGNLNIALTSNSEDEIGKLTNAFSKMADTLSFIIHDVSYYFGEIAKGNFTVSSQDSSAYVGEFKSILSSGEDICLSLNEALQKINQAADQVAGGSEQIAGSSQLLAQGSSEQASSIEELNASVSEMTEHIQESAESALLAQQEMNNTKLAVETGNTHMSHMISAMEDIKTASASIQNIVKTIEDIAFQTNLLSLNAAIEAARAGEAGKGFAVVAEQVKSLAEESALATKDIADLIGNSMRAVEDGSRVADETSAALIQIVENADKVSGMIAKISDTSQIQTNEISQIGSAVEQISNVVEANAATAEESAASSEELSAQSQTMKALTSRFQLRN